MAYTRKVTKKGQVTIPKEMREKFGIDESSHVVVYTDPENEHMIIEPVSRFSALAEDLDTDPNDYLDPLKTREIMENNYERE